MSNFAKAVINVLKAANPFIEAYGKAVSKEDKERLMLVYSEINSNIIDIMSELALSEDAEDIQEAIKYYNEQIELLEKSVLEEEQIESPKAKA